jgi:hypothetical protein
MMEICLHAQQPLYILYVHHEINQVLCHYSNSAIYDHSRTCMIGDLYLFTNVKLIKISSSPFTPLCTLVDIFGVSVIFGYNCEYLVISTCSLY